MRPILDVVIISLEVSVVGMIGRNAKPHQGSHAIDKESHKRWQDARSNYIDGKGGAEQKRLARAELDGRGHS